MLIYHLNGCTSSVRTTKPAGRMLQLLQLSETQDFFGGLLTVKRSKHVEIGTFFSTTVDGQKIRRSPVDIWIYLVNIPLFTVQVFFTSEVVV